MSNLVTKTVIQNGTRSLLLHVYLESDGVEGELTNYVLLDPTTMYTELDLPKDQSLVRPVLNQTWHAFSWFDGLLSFDSLSPAPSWLLCRDSVNYNDFRYFSGIASRYVPPTDPVSSDNTGKILLTTIGFAPAGSIGTLILEIRKNTG